MIRAISTANIIRLRRLFLLKIWNVLRDIICPSRNPMTNPTIYAQMPMPSNSTRPVIVDMTNANRNPIIVCIQPNT